MIEQTRSVDWVMLVIEAAVLILIAYEVGVNIYRHSVETKLRKRRDAILATLSDFMFKGQSIQQKPPTPNEMGAIITNWIRLVTNWRVEVSQYLATVSSRAESAFSLVSEAHQIDQRILHTAGESSFYVTGLVANAYLPLVMSLNNLRGIMEKPEVYF